MDGRAICGLLASLTLTLALANLGHGQTPAGQRPNMHNVAYVLDNERYAADVAAAQDDARRRELLDKRWEAVKLAVLHCDVVMDMAFFHARRYWRNGYPREAVTIHGNLKMPIVQAEDANANKEQAPAKPDSPPGGVPRGFGSRVIVRPGLTIIQGDCLADVTLTAGTSLHVYGDLDATINLKGQNEIIIGGTVKPNASINTDGISRVFIGGDLTGQVVNKGSAKIWVHGNLSGKVGSGTPSTHMHVMGNFTGSLKPTERASLLYIDVRGFTPFQVLESIAHSYTVFSATIGESDRAPGVYPAQDSAPAPGAVRSGDKDQVYWVIHRQTEKRD